MKTQKSPRTAIFSVGLTLCLLPVLALAQPSVELRPDQSDAASSQLVENYVKVSGGCPSHERLRNVVATGTIKESILDRRFELIETSGGQRRITYTWTHLGRAHEAVYAHDGVVSWRQQIAPKKEQPTTIGGVDGLVFPSQIELVAENAVFGRVVFESIQTNQPLDGVSFFKPHSTVPMLRQRPVSTN